MSAQISLTRRSFVGSLAAGLAASAVPMWASSKLAVGDATGGILEKIDQRLTQENLTFGIHNHYFKGEKFAYESPEDVLNALHGLSATVGATADVGHFASCGHDPVNAIRKLAPRLKLV